MSYFNYHAKAKNNIKEGNLLSFKIKNKWNNISPALVLYFSNIPPMPIRYHAWNEYFSLIFYLFKNEQY